MGTVKVRFELREDTAANWFAKNPKLRRGEPGYETDTNQLKVGDGDTFWNDLPYLTGSGGGGAVSSVFGRVGAVVAQSGDYDKIKVGLPNVDNTSDLDKPVSTATQTALGLKADISALVGKANLVGGLVPYSELPPIAFRGTWDSGTTYEAGDSVMFSDSLFGTEPGVVVGTEPFTLTKLLTGTPSNTDTTDAAEYEFFSYFDVSTRIRMTGLTLRKVATQTEVPITVRLWDRDISLTTPLVVKTVTVASNFAGEVIAPLIWDLLPGKNYAVSYTTGLGSGVGYVYTPSFSFPLTVGAVSLRNAGFTDNEGTLTAPVLGNLYWVGIQWQAVNTGWTRLADLTPSEGIRGATGSTGATGPAGPAGETYPLSGYGFIAASMPIEAADVDSNHGPNWCTRVWVPAGKPINSVGIFVTIPGVTGSGNNGFAIYDEAGNFVRATTSDNSLWTADHDWAIRALTSPIAAQASGRFVRVVSSAAGTDPWVLFWNQGSAEKLMQGGYGVSNHRRAIAGITDFSSAFPASINLTTGSTYDYLPLIVLG